MKHLIGSAFVIGRRDFVATVFSKAFLFFLLGPLFPVMLGAVFGGIGAQVASEAEQPVVAVIASPDDFARIEAARDHLADALENSPIIKLVRFDGDADAAAQQKHLLESKSPAVIAVLTDSFSTPKLAGAVQADGSTARQLKLIIAGARAPQVEPGPNIAVTSLGRSSGSLVQERMLTARAGQFLLFFLTILLAGMLLSQLIEEKSNKVIEVLAAAVPIDAIFLGKLFAMLATSIVGIAVWSSAGLAAVAILSEGGLATLPPPAVGWPAFLTLAVLYFAMNYLLLGSVFLSIGAQASTVREVQTLSMPVTMGQVVIFAVATLAIGAPDSPAGLAAAVFPLSSPLVMIARAAQLPGLWPHLLAIGWQLIWVVLILRLGSRLFRRSVLQSGPTRRWWRRSKAVKA
ncbi:ABC transporter permease [Sphingomonas sp.]|uniref:ABC transporter permease n=1 Tax=Sphingomonas sp. TaxID=28214 RepID=UPI00286C8D57|nr:ABC transporter permease [Sphingomonas sp.]